ncbi:MAG: peptide deformylase [Acidobacteria bacterium]|nr:peptide deformylase [Acidobacteriota bacterium]
MIYPIVKYGAAVLEQGAQLVTEFDDRLRQLVADMFETMYAASGVGLAAPQIGISLQLAVIDVTVGKDPNAKLVLVNPQIIHRQGRQKEEEGCLSLPGFHADVVRPERVTIRALDAAGREYTQTGEELLARALCHEIDHLHGTLFIQHLSALKRDLIRRRIRKRARAGDW